MTIETYGDNGCRKIDRVKDIKIILNEITVIKEGMDNVSFKEILDTNKYIVHIFEDKNKYGGDVK